ncbi:MAG: DUF2190 family protein [Desulfovibrio aminophilus]|uniref:DUF2190 family protein n=1 Tax=Desulfovibrio aminophilus TaxID=81425 RepID=UPI00041087C3|nr:DUF2190 family protein [Desulfovibrio aminophilus]MDY0307406.1 DUF2190 family protein [Desulfovibrionaceae bacterium]
MLNHVCEGKVLKYENATGKAIPSGEPVVIGALFGLAVREIPDGGSGSVAISEVFEVRKAAGAVPQGAKLYWDADGSPVSGAAGSGALTTTATDNLAAGAAFAGAADNAPTVQIKLNV